MKKRYNRCFFQNCNLHLHTKLDVHIWTLDSEAIIPPGISVPSFSKFLRLNIHMILNISVGYSRIVYMLQVLDWSCGEPEVCRHEIGPWYGEENYLQEWSQKCVGILCSSGQSQNL